MKIYTILCDDYDTKLDVAQILERAARLLHAEFTIEERYNLTLETDSEQLLTIATTLYPAKEQTPEQAEAEEYKFLTGEELPSKMQQICQAGENQHAVDELLDEWHKERSQTISTPMIQDPVDMARHHSAGLVACNVAERTVICARCQQPFIRSSKNQKYCKKPECVKEACREYQREYQRTHGKGRRQK